MRPARPSRPGRASASDGLRLKSSDSPRARSTTQACHPPRIRPVHLHDARPPCSTGARSQAAGCRGPRGCRRGPATCAANRTRPSRSVSTIFGHMPLARHRASRLDEERPARRVRVIVPPQRALAARLEHLGRPARCGEADVHRELTRGNVRVHPVEHALSALVLVETEAEETAKVIAGLGVALRDGVPDALAERARGAPLLRKATDRGLRRSRCRALAGPSRRRSARRERPGRNRL